MPWQDVFVCELMECLSVWEKDEPMEDRNEEAEEARRLVMKEENIKQEEMLTRRKPRELKTNV